MKKKKRRKKGLDFKTLAVIVLIILIGLSVAFCIMYAMNGFWIGFGVCLAIAIVLFAVTCPLSRAGEIYECPKCGHKFKANPYKVFFTSGFLDLFSFGDTFMKYAKLKCPGCQTKDWCKIERK